MKYKSIIVICSLVIVSFCGCESKSVKNENKSASTMIEMSKSNDYIAEEDDCHNYLAEGIVPVMVQDENGYYYLNEKMLLYYDKNADKSVYLCSKTDCAHQKEKNMLDCDANMFYYDSAIYKYKNHLYGIANQSSGGNGTYGMQLIQMAADGSERKSLYTFANYTSGEGITYISCIHRGYFYYTVANLDSTKKVKATIYRRALEPDAKEEVFYETEENYGVSISVLRGYGNELYFKEFGCMASDSNEYMELKKCNIHTKENKVVRENTYGYYEKFGNKIYVINKDKKMLVEFDEDTGEETELYAIDGDEIYLRSDGEYLYLEYCEWKEDKENEEWKQKIEIIGLDGKLVDVLEDTGEFIGGDENYLFFREEAKEYSEEAEQEVSAEYLCYYKKSDIGSGDYSLRTEMVPE